MNTSPLPQSTWPKPYLLQVMARAVKEGCIRLEFRSLYGAHAERMANSFQGAINRIRRRSDKQHASFIIPEYHLIGTTWEAERGTMLVTYDALPDGVKLPTIHSLDPAERQELSTPEVLPSAAVPLPSQASEPAVPIDPKALVDELLSQNPLPDKG